MREIKTIVIHHSGNTDTVENIRKLHVETNGWDDIGYHFMIDRKGSLILGRETEKAGAHVYGYNEDSIGVCLLGNFDKETLNEKQLKMLNWLINMLLNEFSLSKEDVKFHRDFPDVNKSCPGGNVNKDIFI